MNNMKLAALVFGAGIIGTLLRYYTDLIPGMPSHIWATFTVNVVGSFGLAFTVFHTKVSPSAKEVIGTGLWGSFTTFSAFSAQAMQYLQNSELLLAMLYIIGMVISGYAAAVFGRWISLRLSQGGAER